MSDAYRTYGAMHGTAFLYDKSLPDADTFLTHMEARLAPHGIEAYMEGFMEGKLGEHKRRFPFLRSLSKKGSDPCGA